MVLTKGERGAGQGEHQKPTRGHCPMQTRTPENARVKEDDKRAEQEHFGGRKVTPTVSNCGVEAVMVHARVQAGAHGCSALVRMATARGMWQRRSKRSVVLGLGQESPAARGTGARGAAEQACEMSRWRWMRHTEEDPHGG